MKRYTIRFSALLSQSVAYISKIGRIIWKKLTEFCSEQNKREIIKREFTIERHNRDFMSPGIQLGLAGSSNKK